MAIRCVTLEELKEIQDSIYWNLTNLPLSTERRLADNAKYELLEQLKEMARVKV